LSRKKTPKKPSIHAKNGLFSCILTYDDHCLPSEILFGPVEDSVAAGKTIDKAIEALEAEKGAF